MPMRAGLALNAALKRASLSRNLASLARTSASARFRSVMSRAMLSMWGTWLSWMTSEETSMVKDLPERFRRRHSNSRIEPVSRNSVQKALRSSDFSHVLRARVFRPRISSRE
jgi:hypothetical protein